MIRRILILGTIVAAACCWPALTIHAQPTHDKQFGEVEPGSTLLYVIRPKGPPGANRIPCHLYSGNRLLLELRGNAYTFTSVEPGPHRIWGCRGYETIQFVEGETFFLLCGEQGMALLTAEDGRAMIDLVEYYHPPVADLQEEQDRLQRRAARNLSWIETHRDELGHRIELAEVPVPLRPESVEGLIHVPAGTRVEIEFMETVSSFLNEPGDTIWFRVREDAVDGGQVWLTAGTPIEGTVVGIRPARKGGASGGVEIAIPALDTRGEVTVPLIGQFIGTGRDRAKAANLAAGAGLIGLALAPKGREAFALRGQPWHVWTRGDAWLEPAPSPGEEMEPVGRGPIPEVPVRLSLPLSVDLERHRPIHDITLRAETNEGLSSVALLSVGDWSIPDPPIAKRVSRSGDASLVTYDGWTLLRHLPASSPPLPVRFALQTSDDRLLLGVAEIVWRETSDE